MPFRRHCSADGGSAPFVAQGTPVLLRYASDPSPDVRQAAAYGLGVLSEHAGGAFTDEQCQQACSVLLAVVRAPGARQDEEEAATDNAVSALGKALLYRPAAVGSYPALLDTWVGYLPVRADTVEANVVHRQFCTLLEQHGALLLGSGGERAGAVLRALVSVVVSPELADSKTRQRAAALAISMRAQPAAAAAFAQLQPTLSEAERARLSAALGG